jgi:hypothetical protein
MNIQTFKNGFNFNEINYIFQDFENEKDLIPYQIVSDSQVLIGTNEGVIFFDLSCSINNDFFDNINNFITELYK